MIIILSHRLDNRGTGCSNVPGGLGLTTMFHLLWPSGVRICAMNIVSAHLPCFHPPLSSCPPIPSFFVARARVISVGVSIFPWSKDKRADTACFLYGITGIECLFRESHVFDLAKVRVLAFPRYKLPQG